MPMNDDLIRTTIQKMRDAGISESIIASTLTDLGLNATQVDSYLSAGNARTKGLDISSSKEDSPFSNTDSRDLNSDAFASRMSEKVVQRLDEREALSKESQDLRDTISHVALEQHGQALKDTHQSVMELHDKFDATNLDTLSNRMTQMNTKIDALAKSVSESKAMSLALQGLMQKILEANQQLLFEMKKK